MRNSHAQSCELLGLSFGKTSDDTERTDVSVTHESGRALSAFPSGLVVWEKVDGDGPAAHRPSVDRMEVRQLFGLLARDDVDAVAAMGWEPGYGG